MQTLSHTLRNGFLAIFVGLMFIANSQAQANIQPPDELIQLNTEKMLRSINQHRPEIKKDSAKLTQLVEDIILPHLDFITASKIVMGKYWRQASKEQKINFVRQFRLLLLRFYSSALSEYLNTNNKDLKLDLIKYFPSNLKDGDTDVTIRGEVEQDKGPGIPIFYRMHLTSKGWKIFDVSVEGVSMITTYKNNFATQLKTDGIDALILSLEEKNKNMLADNKTDSKKTN